MRMWLIVAAAILAGVGTAQGQELRADMYLITPGAADQPIGYVLITSGGSGTKFVAGLHGLPPGQHGFHVHDTGNCGPGPNAAGAIAPRMAAGGAFDPAPTRGPPGPGGKWRLGWPPL